VGVLLQLAESALGANRRDEYSLDIQQGQDSTEADEESCEVQQQITERCQQLDQLWTVTELCEVCGTSSGETWCISASLLLHDVLTS
jgi:hypothetical protein